MRRNAYPEVIFPVPAQICFKITQERWLDYLFRQDEYLVQYYAEEQDPPRWVTLPMVTYPERNELCGQTDHLSLFALAIKDRHNEPLYGCNSRPGANPY